MNLPVIAVVILARNRQAYIDMVLARLREQDLPLSSFRVILVDNGSSPSLQPVAQLYDSTLPLTYIRLEDDISRAAARNRGLTEVVEPNVLFLDGDTLPDVDLIRQHLETLEDGQAAVSLGARREPRRRALFDRTSTTHGDYESFAALHAEAWQDTRVPDINLPVIQANFDRIAYRFFFSHNVAMRTAVATAVDGFNEKLSGWGLEDLEFGFRVKEQLRDGELIRWSPRAGSAHVPHLRDFARNSNEIKSNQKFLLATYKSFHWEGHWFAPPSLECLRIIMLERIAEKIQARTVARSHDLMEIEKWVDRDRSRNSWLLSTGHVQGWDTVPTGRRSNLSDWRDRTVPSFCGTQLPSDDSSACDVINIDIWRVLPWHHVSEILAEALRVGETACFVATAQHDADFSSLEAAVDVQDSCFVRDAEWIADGIGELGLAHEILRTPSMIAVRVSKARSSAS
ncbi:glycosyltransferase involved in cell wall biosynthesis [Kutzneria viridogrisea]|uniref:Glycosyltransferase involved in cell wall biosynthesis n=1 Tax=Kutzneria viridogrisea TaxID=47990 RepID=A0ABR6BUN1_9PSEU|nr:glycosyltransferase involved in cell wall biosynthesis [Kutzneria viridogrisea]